MSKSKKVEKTNEIDEKIKSIKDDLIQQLAEQGKIGEHFDDLIEDYIYLLKLKNKLQKDIDEKGIRYQVKTGNGFISNRPNESVQNLLKVNGQMLKILQDLDLKAPEKEPGDGNDLL